MTTAVKTQTLASTFDYHGPVFAADPYAWFERLREAEPVSWSHHWDGFWLVTTYELCRQIITDAKNFSSERRPDGKKGIFTPQPPGPQLSFAEMDDPRHAEIRRALAARFNQASAQEMESGLRDHAVIALDHILQVGTFDVLRDLADHITAQSTLALLQFPPDIAAPIKHALHAGVYRRPQDGGDPLPFDPDTIDALYEPIREICGRRRQDPTDDLTSLLVGNPVTDLVAEDTLYTFCKGGGVGSDLIAGALIALEQHRDQRKKLIDDPSLIPGSFSEFMRYVSPGVSISRTVRNDVLIGGVEIAAGDGVVLALASANHDPEVYDDPSRLDVERFTRCGTKVSPHLGFGYGIHKCIGQWLQRQGLIVALDEVLRRIPDYRIDLEACVPAPDRGDAMFWVSVPATIAPSERRGAA